MRATIPSFVRERDGGSDSGKEDANGKQFIQISIAEWTTRG